MKSHNVSDISHIRDNDELAPQNSKSTNTSNPILESCNLGLFYRVLRDCHNILRFYSFYLKTSKHFFLKIHNNVYVLIRQIIGKCGKAHVLSEGVENFLWLRQEPSCNQTKIPIDQFTWLK